MTRAILGGAVRRRNRWRMVDAGWQSNVAVSDALVAGERCPLASPAQPRPRPYRGPGELEYPLHDRTVIVTNCGCIRIGRRKINLHRAFAGQTVGIKEVAEKIWLVSVMQYDLDFFVHETGRVECALNPFQAQVLPMSSE